jgi:hypothetical protein
MIENFLLRKLNTNTAEVSVQLLDKNKMMLRQLCDSTAKRESTISYLQSLLISFAFFFEKFIKLFIFSSISYDDQYFTSYLEFRTIISCLERYHEFIQVK